MKEKLFVLIFLAVLTQPIFVFAGAPTPNSGGTIDFPATLAAFRTIVWTIFIALAVVMFVYAGILYLTASGDVEKVSQAHKAVLWGVVGIIVAVFAYSALSIIRWQIGA